MKEVQSIKASLMMRSYVLMAVFLKLYLKRIFKKYSKL